VYFHSLELSNADLYSIMCQTTTYAKDPPHSPLCFSGIRVGYHCLGPTQMWYPGETLQYRCDEGPVSRRDEGWGSRTVGLMVRFYICSLTTVRAGGLYDFRKEQEPEGDKKRKRYIKSVERVFVRTTIERPNVKQKPEEKKQKVRQVLPKVSNKKKGSV